jgi:RNA polymerase sigma-70 factor (sigma-E family)
VKPPVQLARPLAAERRPGVAAAMAPGRRETPMADGGRSGGEPDRLGSARALRNEASTWSPDEALAALYPVHWPAMVRLATLLTHDASVAEEVAQDAFVALHRHWRRLADPGAAGGYLRASVVNGARSALRHRQVVERRREPAPPPPPGPEDRAVRSSEDARVMAALRRLPRRQQEVLVLRYWSDLSEQEIATTLGVSRGSVKVHAHRGLAALRATLAAGTEAQT